MGPCLLQNQNWDDDNIDQTDTKICWIETVNMSCMLFTEIVELKKGYCNQKFPFFAVTNYNKQVCEHTTLFIYDPKNPITAMILTQCVHRFTFWKQMVEVVRHQSGREAEPIQSLSLGR